ncbi:MAG TPA: hypothetical protein VGW74_22615, partial [Propionibacteriaceae bacterium]|nr:hypothetical protein [Propionibacteriaceae bacterium]
MYRQLEARQPDEGLDFSFLAEELDRIHEAALRIWKEQQHRLLTTHGGEHIAQVEENLDHLSRPLFEAGRGLSQVEIYVL